MAQTGAKVYVGNLSWNTNDDSLRNAFAQYGNILDVRNVLFAPLGILTPMQSEADLAWMCIGASIVMRDRDTGRSRGFGFVTYSNPAEAQAAIGGLNEQELDGRRIKVNLANARGAGGGGGPPAGGVPPGGGGYGGYPPQGYVGGYQPQGGYGGGGYPAGQQPYGGGYGGGYGGQY